MPRLPCSAPCRTQHYKIDISLRTHVFMSAPPCPRSIGSGPLRIKAPTILHVPGDRPTWNQWSKLLNIKFCQYPTSLCNKHIHFTKSENDCIISEIKTFPQNAGPPTDQSHSQECKPIATHQPLLHLASLAFQPPLLAHFQQSPGSMSLHLLITRQNFPRPPNGIIAPCTLPEINFNFLPSPQENDSQNRH